MIAAAAQIWQTRESNQTEGAGDLLVVPNIWTEVQLKPGGCVHQPRVSRQMHDQHDAAKPKSQVF